MSMPMTGLNDVRVVEIDRRARADAGQRRRELALAGDLEAEAEIVLQRAARRRAVRFVWFEKISFSRSFAWRLR